MEKNVKNNESKNEVKNPVNKEVNTQVNNEAAEAAKKAEQLKQELQKKTEELQKCLQDLQRKQELSNHRTIFINVLDQLAASEARLNEEEDFDSKMIKVKFVDMGNYRDNEVFSIGNKEIILDFITFIRERINKRIAKIEQELIK